MGPRLAEKGRLMHWCPHEILRDDGYYLRCSSMSELHLIRDRNEGGEFSFTANGLFLSFHLRQVLEPEQRTSDAFWAGRSFRGDVKVMLTGERRTFRHRLPARFAHITIPPALLAGLGTAPEALRPHVILNDPPLRHLMDALLAESVAEGSTSQLFAESMAQAIVARLASLNGRGAGGPRSRMPVPLFKRALELIESELSRELSVGKLAQACGLSPSHFTALFKASAGEPPHRYRRAGVSSARVSCWSAEKLQPARPSPSVSATRATWPVICAGSPGTAPAAGNDCRRIVPGSAKRSIAKGTLLVGSARQLGSSPRCLRSLET